MCDLFKFQMNEEKTPKFTIFNIYAMQLKKALLLCVATLIVSITILLKCFIFCHDHEKLEKATCHMQLRNLCKIILGR